MNLFYSEDKELRSGWKIVRVFMFVIILTITLALLAALWKIRVLEEYAFHGAILMSVGLELWLERKPVSYIGLNIQDRGFWKDFLVGIVWGSVSIGLVAAGMIVVTREISVGYIGRGIEIVDWIPLLLFWLVVALAEEGLFRGYILSALKGHVTIAAGLVISAVIFSAVHMINPDYYWFAFLYAFLMGIMLGGVVIKRGSLGCGIGFHYMWNLLQDKGLLNMPARGGELMFAIVLLIAMALVYWLLPRHSAGVEKGLALEVR